VVRADRDGSGACAGVENRLCANRILRPAVVDRGLTSGPPCDQIDRAPSTRSEPSTGLVEPHFMAAYSGVRKVVAPGATQDTIRTFHSARSWRTRLRSSAIRGNLARETDSK